MTADQLALLGDTRLPATARMIGLVISLAGPGGIELGRDHVRALLGPGDPDSDDTIARHFRRLEATGWVIRKAGGRGHSDHFRAAEPHECGSNAAIRSGMGAALSGALAALSDRVGTGAALYIDRVGTGAALLAPSSSYSPPPPPPPNAREVESLKAITPEAIHAIADSGDLLEGCRGSLRDYLAARVKPESQHGYVRRLQASLSGSDEWMWSDRKARKLTHGRTGKIAAALNELLAGGEVGPHFKHPPGDYGNLRTTIRFLVASELGSEDDAKSAPPSSSTPVRARQKFPEPEVIRSGTP